MALTAEQRSLRSRIAAFAVNSKHDGRAITAVARATYRSSFEAGHTCRVCPETVLPATLTPTERLRRWDKNLTGFRGEEEIAFDARPAVYTGNFQRITNVMA